MKKVTKRLLLTALSFVLFTGVSMADGETPKNETNKVTKISGQVIDHKTDETLAGVKVNIAGCDKAVYTDFDGAFQIECDLSKQTEVSLSLISYEGQSVKIESTENLKIKLSRRK
jgi:hypothetical protein